MIDSLDRIDLDNPLISFSKHYSPESIFNEFWNVEKDMSFEELLESEMGGLTEDGEEITATLADAFRAIETMGYWAFANLNTKTIHAWSSGKITDDHLRIVIAHEIGHILEEEPLSDIPEIADEQRADNYGKAAYMTEKILKMLLG